MLCFTYGNFPSTSPPGASIRRRDFTEGFLRYEFNLGGGLYMAWHFNHVTFTPIAKNFMLYCRLIYMLSMLYVRLTIKVKVGIPESFKVGWYPLKITGSSHLKKCNNCVAKCDRYYKVRQNSVFDCFCCFNSVTLLFFKH